MKTDYFLKQYIITTYKDNKNTIYQINIFERESKTTYKIRNQNIINKIQKHFVFVS